MFCRQVIIEENRYDALRNDKTWWEAVGISLPKLYLKDSRVYVLGKTNIIRKIV